MASSSLLNSLNVDKLVVNRLQAQSIRSNNISSLTPSYLYSLVFTNATFDRFNDGGTLKITKLNTESIIEFSDRPFRQSNNNFSFSDFINLFKITSDNSFNVDPPNGVLVHGEEQRTYKITYKSGSENEAEFDLTLLKGESHNLTRVSGKMSLFVDGNTSAPARRMSIEKSAWIESDRSD